ncbi:MAG: hypothetical protein COW24_00445 [Candidatus Kerfeldbacteria bacterium CG15_BIG_FIL_POST_REV_8_21_14_020_45_12]|uniref:Uncharacterized protein n=1 Tax=Candidatus Kerfeldbacteria bacterium CG15_BIG_FIL_POST_REV_8_21_14_020_45_12 TaxID=2014247 RepID=A0A2M7H5B1_9BACT|nr:MAG: hypothetical protein COW24_00445 [Candidatus Kerfeldbacteria bacterium CG15_BIG_FIL_POST_REV_8_21_14_020_45_12]
MMTTAKKKASAPFHPTPSATPEDHRKFSILVALGGVVILLLFVASIPFSVDRRENKSAKALFGAISEGFGAGINRMGAAREAVVPDSDPITEQSTK